MPIQTQQKNIGYEIKGRGMSSKINSKKTTNKTIIKIKDRVKSSRTFFLISNKNNIKVTLKTAVTANFIYRPICKVL